MQCSNEYTGETDDDTDEVELEVKVGIEKYSDADGYLDQAETRVLRSIVDRYVNVFDRRVSELETDGPGPRLPFPTRKKEREKRRKIN